MNIKITNHSFRHASPRLRNQLPDSFRQSRPHLSPPVSRFITVSWSCQLSGILLIFHAYIFGQKCLAELLRLCRVCMPICLNLHFMGANVTLFEANCVGISEDKLILSVAKKCSPRTLYFDDTRLVRMLRWFPVEVTLYKHAVVKSDDCQPTTRAISTVAELLVVKTQQSRGILASAKISTRNRTKSASANP